MNQDLFKYRSEQALQTNAPLADRLRPQTLNEFVGQDAILSEGRLLRRAITTDRVGNLLLYGPPGVGKTTLARIIANNTRAHFSSLNAVLAGVKDLREEIEAAKKRLELYGLRTTLFIDEVHRFNSIQQDALLPWVENGTVSLIGATTENPYFEVSKALVSRSRVFRLQSLKNVDLHHLLKSAIKNPDKGYGKRNVTISPKAASHLVNVANGDARSLFNALELAVESTEPNKDGSIEITLSIAEESIQEKAVLYDKQGDAHFDTISAFIKSLRGSDADAAMFWLARMITAGESPKFIFRRMLIAASEDIGLADPQAMVIVEACASAFERVGLPEGLYSLAQATLYLACAEKSNSITGFYDALRTVQEAQDQEVPSHLRDGHRDKKVFGDGLGYKYPHSYLENWVSQQYLPDALQGEVFWKPSRNGWEGQRRSAILERRATQLAAASESIDENPLLVSFGPEISGLEKWVQRQISQEGDRLNKLRERLWSGVKWRRNDRVLILGSHSLLWAIDPIKSVSEGGITILSTSPESQSRLTAQATLLDPIIQPLIIQGEKESFKALPKELSFEWIGGRLSNQDLDQAQIGNLLNEIHQRSTSKTGLRLLQTSSVFGPASALLNLLEMKAGKVKEKAFLKGLLPGERAWLRNNQLENDVLKSLKALGWGIEVESWEEDLTLTIDNIFTKRLVSKGRPYRTLLEDNQSLEVAERFRKLLIDLDGERISQRLIHKKYVGKKITQG